jgi:hypothetical protein
VAYDGNAFKSWNCISGVGFGPGTIVISECVETPTGMLFGTWDGEGYKLLLLDEENGDTFKEIKIDLDGLGKFRDKRKWKGTRST